MASGSPIEVFNDLVNTTGPLVFTSPQDLVNHIQRAGMYTLNWAIGGQDMETLLQGGKEIQDTFVHRKSGSYRRYNPNPEFDYQLEQVTTNWTAQWRFAKADVSWTEQEILLNTHGMSETARFHQYKVLARSKEMDLANQAVEGMETEMWADPSNADMEATSGEQPYSIFVTVNEFDDGLPPGFSTTQQVDPTSITSWKSHVSTYDGNQDVGASLSDKHLFEALSEAFHKTTFSRLPKWPDLSDPTTSPGVICASLTGTTKYESAMRQNENTLVQVMVGNQNPDYNNPTFRGAPVYYVEELDFAQGFDDGAGGLAAEFDDSVDRDGNALGNPEFQGPRYIGLNFNYLKMAFHEARYFTKKEPFFLPKQPETWVQMVNIYNNLINRSPRQHFTITPSADVLT